MKRVAAALLAAGLLLGACGGDSGPDPEANPKEALISAFESLTESEGLEMVLSLDATAETLNALGGAEGGGLSEEDAAKILESRLTFRSKGRGEDGQVEIVATIAGEDDLTMKVVDKVLYLQVDAEGLVETFGGNPQDLQVAAQQAEAQGLSFVRPVIEGEWLAVTGAEELAQQFGGAPTEDMEASQQQFIEDITNALEETAEVTTEGEDDAGTKLAVSLPIREIYSRLTEALQNNPATAAVPFAQLPPATEVPDESVILDVWVEDDTVTQVAFDFAQVAALEGEEAGGRVALLIQIEEFDDDVEVPDAAAEVSAQELFQLFGGMAGGMGGAGGVAPPGGGGFDCSQLEGAPPAVVEQFAEECPELQNQ